MKQFLAKMLQDIQYREISWGRGSGWEKRQTTAIE